MKNKNQQSFLKSFFEATEPLGTRKEVNGFTLIKTLNPVLNEIIITIFTKESLEKMDDFLRPKSKKIN